MIALHLTLIVDFAICKADPKTWQTGTLSKSVKTGPKKYPVFFGDIRSFYWVPGIPRNYEGVVIIWVI